MRTSIPARGDHPGPTAPWPAGAIVILATLLGACASPPPPAPSSVVLTIGHILDPGGAREVEQVLTREGLVRTTPDGGHQSLLARSWHTTVHRDGHPVLVIELRSGVVFHDGSRLDASAVKRFLDAAAADPRRHFGYPALADIESVEAVTPTRVAVHLRQRSEFILDALALGISHGDAGTGPFRLETRTADRTTLVVNPRYHRGRPSIDVVSLVSYPTLRTAWAAMMRDEVDMLLEVPTAARAFVEAESRIDLHRTIRPYAISLVFNHHRPTFGDPRLRQALNHAVDREAIVAEALGGDGRPASGIWSLHQAYDGVERIYAHDPARADRLLTRAGFPPVPAPGAGPGSGEPPSRFEFLCVVPTYTEQIERVALLVQRQLWAMGIHMRIVSTDRDGFPAPVLEIPEWDAVLAPNPTGQSLSRLYSMWHSSAAYNFHGYGAADEVLEAMPRVTDPARAARAFQTILYEDPPAIFLVDETRARAVSRRFQIPPVLPGHDIIGTLWQWEPMGP